ncbi:glycosyltransferase family 61 protein [Hymenobacter sp. BT770]|uniref:glycosyltransferase family 61 protein n=1 Tax=Hymenobacter sp. BT770 TaxID=2886942 RepID=UPI001D130552|nr:glycosyltransferase family 61 protein [Hymenobacter sp. BT770]MCC3153795.1 glycosyltransferase family 61 protein [Hymenobacter sp. BT770]MDO3415939.1 glycosyltransferase family 61 protein [Hymenobacter sp. BT770]
MSTSVISRFKRVLMDLADKAVALLPEWTDEQSAKLAMRDAIPAFTATLPVNMATIPASHADRFREPISFSPKYLYTLRNVYVSYLGVVFRNGRIFQPSLVRPDNPAHVYSSLEGRQKSAFLARQWGAQVRHPLADTQLPLVLAYESWSAQNYYHWFCDALPRLLLLRQHYSTCTLLLPHALPAFARESLAYLGFCNLHFIGKQDVVKVNELIFPEPVASGGLHDPELIQQVRDALLQHATPLATPHKPKRLYVSRARAHKRKPCNEAQVVALLHQYDFAVVYLEDHSFAEQVELLRDSEILVGMHGAGLTNLLFLPTGSHVIEFMNAESMNLCYYHLASAIGVQYSCLLCSPIVQTGLDPNHSDILVDLVQLKETITGVLQKHN